MLILGIDTSCDETSAAVVEDGVAIKANVVRSQQGLHEEHGGIVPEAASRAHLGAIVPAVREVMLAAGAEPHDLAAIAVTSGPGLGGSLMVGLNAAKGLAYGWQRPLLPINHLEGHVYSAWPAAYAAGRPLPAFPVVVLIVSGGHTELVLMRTHSTYERLGGTRDDAAGEAFDKVGRLLGLPYPGGPSIERAARAHLEAGGGAHHLPQAWLRGTDDFSFSGIKTAVLHIVDPGSAGRRADARQGTEPLPTAGGWRSGGGFPGERCGRFDRQDGGSSAPPQRRVSGRGGRGRQQRSVTGCYEQRPLKPRYTVICAAASTLYRQRRNDCRGGLLPVTGIRSTRYQHAGHRRDTGPGADSALSEAGKAVYCARQYGTENGRVTGLAIGP